MTSLKPYKNSGGSESQKGDGRKRVLGGKGWVRNSYDRGTKDLDRGKSRDTPTSPI